MKKNDKGPIFPLSDEVINQKTYWIDLPSVKDDRGILTVLEENHCVPFPIKRVFYMHSMTAERGGHAHVDTDQIVIAVSGSFSVKLTGVNGVENTFKLDNPCKGLYIPRMTFLNISDISREAVCLVLASTIYNIEKSIRSLADFERHIERAR